MPIKVARIFNTYGPRMHPNDGRVVSNFIVQALLGRDITIYGDGSQTRSFCYVDDLLDGIVRLMGTDEIVTGPINIGNPTEFTILQLASEVIRITGSRARVVKSAAAAGRSSPTATGYFKGAGLVAMAAANASPRWAEADNFLFRRAAS